LAVDVIRRLRGEGHIAYLAGGCVRDLLLGLDAKDFDVATSARPEEVKRIFPRSLAVGASFGVMAVPAGSGRMIEIATFRADGPYSDARRPDSIEYTTPQLDAQRRDFTINGMFLDPVDDRVLDYVGGQDDLARKVIRAIGVPSDRFREDRLRMLRATRFAARLGFAIEPATLEAIRSMAPGLSAISAERVLAELRGILEPVSRVRGVELLSTTGLLPIALAELAATLADPATLVASLGVLGAWPKPVSLALAIAGLAVDVPDAGSAVGKLLHRLRASNDDIEKATWLIGHRDALDGVETLPRHRVKRVLASPWQPELLDLMEGTERMRTGCATNIDAVRKLVGQWGEAGIDPPCFFTGEDLIRMGHRPGPMFKTILDDVRDKQLDGELASSAEATEYVRWRWPAD
jgi:tRNA nucleotidyltransferase/poly(A) polymerase